MNDKKIIEAKEKKFVTVTSVLAAVLLTSTKLIVGLLTGSLGILSEALHSGLDLIAAVMTYFAVKFGDKPPDEDHQFGHGKIENLSALFETLLLLMTCTWIVYEAVDRLTSGTTHIEVTVWSFAVIILSIIVDFSRSRALLKIAKKYNNQALEADALHFSTDIWSSAVVIIGLLGALLGYHYADSVAALVVAVIVIIVCFRLGKRAIDALLDKSPVEVLETINNISKSIPEIIKVHDIKTRTSGSYIFIEVNIHVEPSLTIEQAHSISHKFENMVEEKVERSQVHIHIEPDGKE